MSARRGVFVFVLLLVFLGAAAVFAALTLRHPSGSVPDSSVLVFDVPEEMDEGEAPESPYAVDWFRPSRPLLWKVVFGLRQAAEDDRIAALVLHVGPIDWGWAKISEVRDAVAAFRAAGKPVYASFTGGGEREYLLASAADLISAPPLTTLQLDGLTASALFMKGTFDKLDVTPNFAQAGAYKSGAEGYTRNDMSPPAREALQALVDDLYDTLLDSLSTARDLPRDTIASILDEGPYDAPLAWTRGLIDTVLYEPELDSLALDNVEDSDHTVTLWHYVDHLKHPSTRSRFAMVVASGTISDGKSRDGPGDGEVLGSETLIKALDEVRERKSVKAVILRVDSPGGSAPASDEMWRAVEQLRSVKPVVISMSDYAASGGYYLAVGGSSIVAQPNTITGSIGVYGGKLNIIGLYRKLGLNVETVTRGKHAEMLSPFKDFTPEESERFKAGILSTYSTFLDRVAEGRDMKLEDVEKNAQGRVWSGLAAADNGLVDELGGIDKAVEVAKGMVGIPAGEAVAVEVYPKVEKSFLQRLFSEMFSEDWEETALRRLPGLAALLDVAALPSGVALTWLPYRIDIR
jgi:protease IV